jgi:hypothetical protein
MQRNIAGEDEMMADRWELSSPVPGIRILNTWQIYRGIWLVLAITDGGQYNIFRSVCLQGYELVHTHATEIYGIYYVDDGHALFCATDGWWASPDAGLSWSEVTLGGDHVPKARTAAIIPLRDGYWVVVAYDQNRKIYRCVYPGGSWAEEHDTAYTEKWYPALAGCAVGVLAGAGNQLLRSYDTGETWEALREVAGTIKSIAISGQSDLPIFLFTIETEEGDKLFFSHDLGDSLEQVASRVGAITSVQAVTPTGTNEMQTIFAVLGKREADGVTQFRIIQE